MKQGSTKILGLRTIGFKVGDLDKAKRWYAKVFDCEPYFDEPFYVGFNIAGYELGLQPDDQHQISTAENVYHYWGVEDIREIKSKLLNLGATLHEDITNDGGELEVLSFRDPWGNVIGFIYNPYFKLP